MTTDLSEQTREIQGWIERLRQGDEAAREALLRIASNRLLLLTRKIKRDFRRVGRWEQTDDVFQAASLRLYQSLVSVRPNDAAHFFNLAATQIRRELIDLNRHYLGPYGIGHNQRSRYGTQSSRSSDSDRGGLGFDPAELTNDPQEMMAWTEFHRVIEELSEPIREVVNLIWYHGMTQDQAAQVLGTSSRHVRRLWRSARLTLHARLGSRMPGR